MSDDAEERARGALLAAARRVVADTRTSSRHTRTGRLRGRPSIADSYRYDADGEYIPDLQNDSNYARPERLRTLPADLAGAVALELARREGLKGDAKFQRAAALFQAGTGRPVSAAWLRTLAITAYRDMAVTLLATPWRGQTPADVR